MLRKRHFASSEFPDAERECAFWWREINSDDAAAGWLPWTRPRALTVGRGHRGKTERTHMALLLQLQKATGRWLAGWMGAPGFACRTDHHAAYPHFPWALPRTSISPQSPFLVAGLILPLHTIFPRVIAVASSLRFL